MAITPKTFSARHSIVRYGTVAVILPLFLAPVVVGTPR